MARLVRPPLTDASLPRAAATAPASPGTNARGGRSWRGLDATEARRATPDGAILIVEDNHAAGSALRRAVESHGHRAILVRDATDGLREATRNPVALALVGIGPRRADLDLVAELRCLPDPPDVIVIAGRADRASALAAVEAGA